MPKLSQLTAAPESQAPTLTPVDYDPFANEPQKTKVSPLAMLGRQFVAGGGDLLKAGGALIPFGIGSSLDAGGHNPLTNLGQDAQDYGDLSANESADGLGAEVMGGIGRLIPNLAGAIATGGEATLANLVPEGVRMLPFAGRALTGIAAGAPTSAALTGIQDANLPDTMSSGEKLREIAKDAGVNLVMAGIPVAAGKSALTRIGTGAGIGFGTSAGISALEGKPQDPAQNIVQAITGGLLGRASTTHTPNIDPLSRSYMDNAAPPHVDPVQQQLALPEPEVAKLGSAVEPPAGPAAMSGDDVRASMARTNAIPTTEPVSPISRAPLPPPPQLTPVESNPFAKVQEPIAPVADAAPSPSATNVRTPEVAAPEVAKTPNAPITTESPSVNQSEGSVSELPIADLKLSDDVPQFKSGAGDNGVVEALGGTFDRRGTGPVQVWKRNNGQMEVISGRHRLDLARRSGEKTIPAQVYNESDGFTADHAAALDAELNIRDGQGKVKDYVQFFQHPAFNGEGGQQTAESRGLLARSTGRRAFTIASKGDAELIAAHSADRISDEAAFQIAKAAPNNAPLQALGMKLVQEGKPIGMAANTMRAVSTMQPSQSSGDMFGFEDSAINDGIKLAQAASGHQRDISERLSAITGASKRPELARKEGIDVHDPKSLQSRIGELKAEKESWDRFDTDPAKMTQLRKELGMERDEPAAEPTPESPALVDTGPDMFGGPKPADHLDAASRAKDAQRNGKAGGREDTGDGGLFDGKRPEQTSLDSVDDQTDTPSSPTTEADRATSKRLGSEDADDLGLRKAVSKLLGPIADKVEYMRGYEGLPDNMLKGVLARNSLGRKGVTAALYNPVSKRVFLFTNVIKRPESAAWHVAHEIAGHLGLREAFGPRMDHMLNIARQNPTVKALADEIHKQRKISDQMRQSGQTPGRGHLLATEEALAELAAAVRTGNYDNIQERYGVKVPPGIRATIKQAIADFLKRLRAMMDDLFGRHVFTDEDVRSLLDAAFEAAQRKTADSPTFSMRK